MLNALPSDVKSKILKFLIKRCYITITENNVTKILDFSLVYTHGVPNLLFDIPNSTSKSLARLSAREAGGARGATPR